MSLFTSLYGSGAGAPIGTIVVSAGVINDMDWLPLTNGVYNKADYPDLDVSKMLTFDGQSLQIGVTLPSMSACRVFHVTGSTWYAHSTVAGISACYRSVDNGATWTSGTLPQIPASYYPVSYANGLFFQTRSDAAQSGTYYTSTDGLSWVTRTFPNLSGYYASIGGVVYAAGRYIALPAYSTVNLPFVPSFYSTDGITWTSVNIYSHGQQNNQSTGLYYVASFGRPDVSNKVGIQLQTSNGAAVNQYFTYDGLNWVNNIRYTAASGLDSMVTVGGVGQTATGDYATGSSLFVGNHTRSRRNTNAGFGGFPMRGTNITVGNGVSEDHGVSKSNLQLPWYSVTTDFSGSRLLNISSAGLVSWIDVNPLKFRAIPPLQDAELPLIGQTLYIKAR